MRQGDTQREIQRQRDTEQGRETQRDTETDRETNTQEKKYRKRERKKEMCQGMQREREKGEESSVTILGLKETINWEKSWEKKLGQGRARCKEITSQVVWEGLRSIKGGEKSQIGQI